MKISYAITVYNEIKEIQRLLNFLIENKTNEDEIIVLMDNKGPDEVWDYLLSIEDKLGVLSKLQFKNDFSEWKNKLTKMCSGDYIYQIDADEMVDEYVLRLLPQVLEYNNVDVLLVPRINLVEGLTTEHINKWRWRINKNNWINFPDYQYRIYKNNDKIKWKNKVHETLEGYETVSHLPQDREWCLLHEKTIERQEKQNNYYNTL
jgi:glycosyltransferase involved in cell wall biosynthesis